MKNHEWSCEARLGLECTCDAPEELCPGCQPCPICGNDNEHRFRQPQIKISIDNAWDTSEADPIEDIRRAKEFIRTGKY